MLWDAKVCRVDDFESNFVRGPGDVAQSLQNLLERCIVLRDQAFDVLQKKCTRAFYGQRGDDVVDDQPAASGITHSLSNSHRRERLARKTSNIKIMVWEFLGWPNADVLEQFFGSGGPCVTQANHTAADGINLACRCHLILARQPESLEHVGQRLQPGTLGHDSYFAGGRDHGRMTGGGENVCRELGRQAQPTPMLS
jgi:hypothetical protein